MKLTRHDLQSAMTHFPENKVGFHIFLIALTHAEVTTTILRYNEWVPGHCYAVANVFWVVFCVFIFMLVQYVQ